MTDQLKPEETLPIAEQLQRLHEQHEAAALVRTTMPSKTEQTLDELQKGLRWTATLRAHVPPGRSGGK
jgi:hypothetical protein